MIQGQSITTRRHAPRGLLLAWMLCIPLELPAQPALPDSVALLLQRGHEEFRLDTRESLQESIRLHQEALPLLRNAGEQRWESMTLNHIGMSFSRLDRPDSAQAFYTSALLVAREVNEPAIEATILANIGSAWRDLRQPDSARAAFAGALDLQRVSQNGPGQGTALTGIGAAYLDLDLPDSALTYFEKALVVFRDLDDHPGESTSLSNIGVARHRSGLLDSALVSFREALRIRHELEDREGESSILKQMGLVFRDVGVADSTVRYLVSYLAAAQDLSGVDGESETFATVAEGYLGMGYPDSAWIFAAEGLGIAREVDDRPGEAASLDVIGSIQRVTRRSESAFQSHASALAIRRALGDIVGEGATLTSIGRVHLTVGNTDSAQVYFSRALSIARETQDLRGEAAALGGIASAYARIARSDLALGYLASALPIQERIGNRGAAGGTLHSMGEMFADIGREDSARAYYFRALAVRREIEDRWGEAATLAGIGYLYGRAIPTDSALVYLSRALTLLRGLSDLDGEGMTLIGMGWVHLRQHRMLEELARMGPEPQSPRPRLTGADSALRLFRDAVAIAREVGNRELEADALSSIGAVHDFKGEADSAAFYFGRGLSILREVDDPWGELMALKNLGRVYHRTFSPPRLDRAVAYYDSAAAVTAAVNSSLRSDEHRLRLAEWSAELFDEWPLAWLARADEVGIDNAVAAALAASERGRAQALRDLMRGSAPLRHLATAAEVPIPPGADLVAEGRALADSLARLGIAAIQYRVTKDTLLLFLAIPGREVQIYHAPVEGEWLRIYVAMLRAELCLGFADSRARAGPFAMRDPWDVEQRVPFCGLGAAGDTLQAITSGVAALLVPADLGSLLPAHSELVIVPDGPLSLLPFAILPLPLGEGGSSEPDTLLGLRYAIRYAPSLRTLLDLESGTQSPVRFGEALVVGGVGSDLAGAQDEADWVAAAVGSEAITGDTATETAVRARLGTATLIHFATHGYAYASTAQARDSYIAFAEDAEEDGFLTAGEVLDEIGPLSAELVVLSACQTGMGSLTQNEGTVGLQRAFLAGGARRMLVSLWKVDDQATMLLMQHFYTNLLNGDSTAEALRKAQETLSRIERFAHPRFWAAYQAIGAR